jgi:hypothetical protein
MICTPYQILLGDQIKDDETVGACSTYEAEEKCIHGFGREPKGKTSLGRARQIWEDNIKTDINRKKDSGLIHPAQDRDKFRALVYRITNLQVP